MRQHIELISLRPDFPISECVCAELHNTKQAAARDAARQVAEDQLAALAQGKKIGGRPREGVDAAEVRQQRDLLVQERAKRPAGQEIQSGKRKRARARGSPKVCPCTFICVDQQGSMSPSASHLLWGVI